MLLDELEEFGAGLAELLNDRAEELRVLLDDRAELLELRVLAEKLEGICRILFVTYLGHLGINLFFAVVFLANCRSRSRTFSFVILGERETL
jgi:hypothetical protein